MRTDLMLLAVAMVGASFDRVVATPSADVAAGMLLAQNSAPLATPAINPRLGSAPPGGHLPGSVESAREEAQARRAAPLEGADAGGAAVDGSAVPANPAGRLGTINENRLGAPPNGAVGAAPNAPAGGPAGAGSMAPLGGAVAPPAAGAVQAPPGATLPPAAGR